ncbi:MAG: acyl carrier protein [Caldilineaceae bacterium]|nr:acyl carrier protein [Caldilineaceae bacterium]
MTSTDILLEFIQQELIDDPSNQRLNADDDLLIGGVLDSLAIIRLVEFIERELGRSVGPEDITIENFRTVGSIVKYLGKNGV